MKQGRRGKNRVGEGLKHREGDKTERERGKQGRRGVKTLVERGKIR